ncbi:MAG TPA: helicase, partial [Anaeromyxobacteraceae bacterium]|nr:helicase [Anaeromyxobacteraceae bacterium]
VASRQAERYLDLAPIAVMVDLETGHRVVPGAAERLEEEAESVGDARLGAAPPALLEAALAAARKEADAILARRKEEALEALDAHYQGEEMRLVEAGFGGGASRAAIEAALHALRHHREVTGRALDRLKLGLEAAAVVVP